MSDPRERARSYFDDLWSKGDHWHLASSEYSKQRFAAQMALVGDRPYARALEYGCGAGDFTRLLATVAEHVVALDVAETAIERARGAVPQNVELRVSDALEFDVLGEGPFDLIVLSEVVYYLGWLNTFFDVAWMAHRIFEATAAGGRVLLCNTIIEDDDDLESPWLVRTYRDLFLNVGFRLEREQTLSGDAGGGEVDALLTLATKD